MSATREPLRRDAEFDELYGTLVSEPRLFHTFKGLLGCRADLRERNGGPCWSLVAWKARAEALNAFERGMAVLVKGVITSDDHNKFSVVRVEADEPF